MYKENMQSMILNYERYLHWRVVFEDNDGGTYDDKALLCAKRWYVYMSDKQYLIKGGSFL